MPVQLEEHLEAFQRHRAIQVLPATDFVFVDSTNTIVTHRGKYVRGRTAPRAMTQWKNNLNVQLVVNPDQVLEGVNMYERVYDLVTIRPSIVCVVPNEMEYAQWRTFETSIDVIGIKVTLGTENVVLMFDTPIAYTPVLNGSNENRTRYRQLNQYAIRWSRTHVAPEITRLFNFLQEHGILRLVRVSDINNPVD